MEIGPLDYVKTLISHYTDWNLFSPGRNVEVKKSTNSLID